MGTESSGIPPTTTAEPENCPGANVGEGGRLRVWTNGVFEGHYPVGTAAVVVAENQEKAGEALSLALCKMGLGSLVAVDSMIELELGVEQVRILCDGNY